MGVHTRVRHQRAVQLVAIGVLIIGAIFAALVWRRAVLERRLTRHAVLARLQHAADAGRGAMLQEIARVRDTLREAVDAPADVRLATLATLAGDDAERTAILLEDRRVTLVPARVLRYVPDPPAGEGPAPLIARCARLPRLPRASRSAEAAAILRDLESGTWTLSRSTYESLRDELEDFIPAERALPLWEEAVHAVRAASRATAGQGGEVVIWVDDANPVLLVWHSGQAAAIALAVTGRHVAERWLRAERAVGYGIETAARQAFLPRPPGDQQAERLLSFAGREWRMITVARTGGSQGP